MTAAYQLNNITVQFADQRVLDIPQLAFERNKCIALLGDNGAGKSTLLNLLSFVSAPTSGEIILAGEPVTLPLTRQQRRTIAYVAQHPYLLKGSVLDNIQLALKLQGINKKYHDKYITEALTLTNLSHLIHHPADTLSGGELRRVAIARAVVYQPKILLLDEPFSHLDQSHQQQLEDIIHRYARDTDTTIIFSTHDRLQGQALSDTSVNLVSGKTTQSPLLNLFHGQLNGQIFHTERLQIHAASQLSSARYIAINPNEIIVSNEKLSSSMRNHFQGRLITISEEKGTAHLTVDCGQRFHTIISLASLSELNLNLGNTVWLSFKATAVSLF